MRTVTPASSSPARPLPDRPGRGQGRGDRLRRRDGHAVRSAAGRRHRGPPRVASGPPATRALRSRRRLPAHAPSAAADVARVDLHRRHTPARATVRLKEVLMRRILLTATAALAALAASLAAYGGGGMGSMGMSGSIARPALHGYYDGHKDTFLNTDVSDQMQAAEMHINYSPLLGKVLMSDTSEIYLVQGQAAPGQIPVLG